MSRDFTSCYLSGRHTNNEIHFTVPSHKPDPAVPIQDRMDVDFYLTKCL